MVLVLDVENLVIFHQVDLQQHVFRVPDKLLSYLSRFFVGFELWVLLPCVQALLVRVNLGFDLAGSDKICQFSLNNLERKAESRRDLAHVNDFVGLHVLLEGQRANLLENIVTSVLAKEEVVLQLLLDAV